MREMGGGLDRPLGHLPSPVEEPFLEDAVDVVVGVIVVVGARTASGGQQSQPAPRRAISRACLERSRGVRRPGCTWNRLHSASRLIELEDGDFDRSPTKFFVYSDRHGGRILSQNDNCTRRVRNWQGRPANVLCPGCSRIQWYEGPKPTAIDRRTVGAGWISQITRLDSTAPPSHGK